jgi:hypothetical protein
MDIRNHRGFGHGLRPGTTEDINCLSCQREKAGGLAPDIEGKGTIRRSGLTNTEAITLLTTWPVVCPLGMTGEQVAALMGDRLAEFNGWMTGQTIGWCDGQEYRHERGPCFEEVTEPGAIGDRAPVPAHERYEDHTWLCGYPGGGVVVATSCADNPHGMVWYRSDVYRFLRGLPVVD